MRQTQTDQRWWRALLSPGWIIAAILIGLFSYYAFTFLAPWQLGKNERLVQRNEHIAEAFEHDPQPIADVLRPDGTMSEDDEWSRVVATGQYVGSDVLLRLRPIDRTPAFQVLTPLRLTTGQTVLVNRGWVPAEDSTRVPPIAPAPDGDVTVTGFMLLDEGVHPSPPLSEQGYEMVYSISPGQVGDILGEDVAGDLASPYLQLSADSPGVLQPIPLPQLETGNHLSYGLQWILFGFAAPAGLLYFLFADARERRRYQEEQEQLRIDDTPAGAGPDPSASKAAGASTSVQSASAAPSAPARSRYGSSRANPWAKAYDKEAER